MRHYRPPERFPPKPEGSRERATSSARQRGASERLLLLLFRDRFRVGGWVIARGDSMA